ncbi:uncharacterized protein LOC120670831 [Panicum virgatum]|uniref:uncharacterized protein LOC120670831 n=1 Tax=Panicum virgatum TaxID=38727 RepID=UPI0019D5B83C|nr:uncharacterized protein LOC120670831 [Panicum virgatum]
MSATPREPWWSRRPRRSRRRLLSCGGTRWRWSRKTRRSRQRRLSSSVRRQPSPRSPTPLCRRTSSSRRGRWPSTTQRPRSKRRRPLCPCFSSRRTLRRRCWRRKRNISRAVADETTAKEALQVAFTSMQDEHEDLETTAVAVCQELEGEGGLSGSSVASLLRSLGGQVIERLKGALRLGVQKALGMVSTHYVLDLEQVATGYVVAPGVDGDVVVAFMDQADAVVEDAASALYMLFEGELLPDAEDDAAEGPHDGEDDL